MVSLNSEEHFNRLVSKIPDEFQEHIYAARNSVKDIYSVFEHNMPVPVWQSKGFNDTDIQVWEQICRKLKNSSKDDPVSIYLHIPFCKDGKCGFCDCLSIAVNKGTDLKRFTEILINEIRTWSEIPELKNKPVSVIYLGGGTPNSLSDNDFKRVLQELAEGFNVSSKTQISVECRAHLLNNEKLDFLKSLNVTRISIGIQTMEEKLRNRIGRHSKASEIPDIIRTIKDKGIIACGDIIYGLPDQTVTGYIKTINDLIIAGIDGISVYRFNISDRNNDFIRQTFPYFKKDEMLNYILFHIGHRMLIGSGYKKNHFIHFSKADDNSYYRHLLRGEDLIAIGPTSDGIIDTYRYRNHPLKEYLTDKNGTFLHFEGGMEEPPEVKRNRKAATQVMCSYIEKETFQKPELKNLFDIWVNHKIIEKDDMENTYHLTANGSWLVDQLLREIYHNTKERK
ncbi:MAG: radical SAM protein [Bacteroidales bacterium]|nr:radical SAM protein [Bacteroidales bacterium]